MWYPLGSITSLLSVGILERMYPRCTFEGRVLPHSFEWRVLKAGRFAFAPSHNHLRTAENWSDIRSDTDDEVAVFNLHVCGLLTGLRPWSIMKMVPTSESASRLRSHDVGRGCRHGVVTESRGRLSPVAL